MPFGVECKTYVLNGKDYKCHCWNSLSRLRKRTHLRIRQRNNFIVECMDIVWTAGRETPSNRLVAIVISISVLYVILIEGQTFQSFISRITPVLILLNAQPWGRLTCCWASHHACPWPSTHPHFGFCDPRKVTLFPPLNANLYPWSGRGFLWQL